MQMTQVQSSNVAEVGYNSDTEELQIIFLNGSSYLYLNVPQNEYENLLQAPSIGSYFNRYIRNQYPYDRIG
jgi:hypothetical protein